MHHPIAEELESAIERAREILATAKQVAVLTGAGISAESGVPTFRASDGLWEGHRIEDVASPYGFERSPETVWKFYNERRANVAKVKPNPGHYALVELEKRLAENFTLVTQNVDGLHRVAGSTRVLEIHGSLYRTRCTKCGTIEDRGLEPLGELPHCSKCGSLLRPDIVWFHEALPDAVWEDALYAAATCDVMMVVGTSAVVHPAASLIPIAKSKRTWSSGEPPAQVIEINLTRTEASEFADVGLYGRSGEILPRLVT